MDYLLTPLLGKRAVWWWLCCVSSSALLGLLVVGCFECFGFTVEYAEASWLLEVGFYGLPTYSCYFGHGYCYFGGPKPINWQAWCLFYHLGDHFVSLGTPWGTVGAAGRTRGGPEPGFSDLGMILRPQFDSFLGLDKY